MFQPCRALKRDPASPVVTAEEVLKPDIPVSDGRFSMKLGSVSRHSGDRGGGSLDPPPADSAAHSASPSPTETQQRFGDPHRPTRLVVGLPVAERRHLGRTAVGCVVVDPAPRHRERLPRRAATIDRGGAPTSRLAPHAHLHRCASDTPARQCQGNDRNMGYDVVPRMCGGGHQFDLASAGEHGLGAEVDWSCNWRSRAAAISAAAMPSAFTNSGPGRVGRSTMQKGAACLRRSARRSGRDGSQAPGGAIRRVLNQHSFVIERHGRVAVCWRDRTESQSSYTFGHPCIDRGVSNRPFFRCEQRELRGPRDHGQLLPVPHRCRSLHVHPDLDPLVDLHRRGSMLGLRHRCRRHGIVVLHPCRD